MSLVGGSPLFQANGKIIGQLLKYDVPPASLEFDLIHLVALARLFDRR
jgi:hypothetical protein